MKRFCIVVAISAVGCGNAVDNANGTESPQLLAVATYNFGTISSPGKCMDVAGGATADGTNIHQWTCNGTGAQSIRVEALGGGLSRLVHTSSGKCVDISGAGTADGTNIQLWTCNGTVAQQFRIEDAGNSNVRLVNPNSNKCVDVSGAGTADGTNIQLWTCNGTNAQLWRPAQINGEPNPSGAWPSIAARSDGKWVRVMNKCSFPIWIHGAGSSGVLSPDDAQLTTGQSRDYLAPNEWSAARVTAFVDGPRQGELEKAEFTFTGGVLNYNVTYVDWVGLPLEIVGVGGNCNASTSTTGCYAAQASINNGCPEGFLRDGRKCLSARTYCANPVNQSSSYCHALDGAISSCAGCPKDSTTNVYMCAGAYTNEPRWCAALNRGMTSAPDNPDPSLYYKSGAYNSYAKWVHEVCPDIYAFSYDDWLSHGGFRACSGDEVRVTFCPNG